MQYEDQKGTEKILKSKSKEQKKRNISWNQPSEVEVWIYPEQGSSESMQLSM